MKNKDKTLNILLIGIDYFSNRCSGDKNFWHNLLPTMDEKINKFVIISFNYRTIKIETQPTQNHPILIYNVPPSHIGIDLHLDPSTLGNREKCHPHFKSPPRSPIEHLLSFFSIRSLIQRVMIEHKITNVHCMDNFGPAMHLLQRWVSPTPLSVSAMGYYARGPLHDQYLKLCYRRMDAIVPFSSAYHQKLLDIGLPEQKLYTIPWGRDIKSIENAATSGERESMKRDLKIPFGFKVVLWTGFIQQIKEKELYASLEVAHNLIQLRDDVYFVFALKPECYHPDYQNFVTPQIRVLSTTNKVFLNLLHSADYLLSPITNVKSIVTPPLTWIEAMAVGLPIVTNKVSGVESVILPGENGFIAESINALPALLDIALSHKNKEKIRKNARNHILTHYAITKSAIGYQTLWQKLQNQQRGSYDKS